MFINYRCIHQLIYIINSPTFGNVTTVISSIDRAVHPAATGSLSSATLFCWSQSWSGGFLNPGVIWFMNVYKYMSAMSTYIQCILYIYTYIDVISYVYIYIHITIHPHKMKICMYIYIYVYISQVALPGISCDIAGPGQSLLVTRWSISFSGLRWAGLQWANGGLLWIIIVGIKVNEVCRSTQNIVKLTGVLSNKHWGYTEKNKSKRPNFKQVDSKKVAKGLG